MGVKLSSPIVKLEGTVAVFPSPCGVMGVKHNANLLFRSSLPSPEVSVPLRGNGCET